MKNDGRIRLIGLKIAYYRKLAGLTQEQLAEKAGISAGYLSQIESPGMDQSLSMNTFLRLADSCGIEPYKLLMF